LQLRFQLEDYVSSTSYEPEKGFSYQLKNYIHIFRKFNKQFAADMDVHISRLSRLLKGKEMPNIEFMYRLETYSGELIPALLWWKLLSKKQESEIQRNQEQRQMARSRVKNAFSHSLIKT
jgi:transcriptional regulator with XRE-family HTH domain